MYGSSFTRNAGWSMDLPKTLRYITHFLIVNGDILIREPQDHLNIGENPSWVGHLVVRVKLTILVL